mmetsp:Transcript_14253/g.11746  ORF Transcript_14253/g.11746 Transcript_14253/m.11746 type:complete len:118 (+) Transcript_14253:1161-1514(+)
MFEIKDNGKGITKEKLPKIFDEKETDENGENWDGTGLGLPICLSICKNMDAFIKYSSILNLVTQFRLYVPHEMLATNPRKNRRIQSSNSIALSSTESLNHSCNQVLLAEDNPNILKK